MVGWGNFTILSKFYNPGIPEILGIPGVKAVSQFLRCFKQNWKVEINIKENLRWAPVTWHCLQWAWWPPLPASLLRRWRGTKPRWVGFKSHFICNPPTRPVCSRTSTGHQQALLHAQLQPGFLWPGRAHVRVVHCCTIFHLRSGLWNIGQDGKAIYGVVDCKWGRRDKTWPNWVPFFFENSFDPMFWVPKKKFTQNLV